jgi:two-component system, OmpR family, sensor kinase
MVMKETIKYDSMKDEIAFMSRKILDLNKRLIESEKAKSRFLSLVTSELNNPMTALVGMMPHLQVQSCEKNKQMLFMINKEVLELDFKIKNLMMAAQIESGKIDVSAALFDPMEVIEEVIESLKYISQERKITINITDCIQDKIVSDPQKIYLIAENLLLNGCKYANESSTIEVVLKREDSIFTLSVKNQGEGPNIQYKPEIFTRFADGPDGEHGLGIGLSVVRAICERFDGSVNYAVDDGFVTFLATLSLGKDDPDSQAHGSNEFLFDSFDDAIEL